LKIGIATDHGGFGLKKELVAQLHGAGHEVIDLLAELTVEVVEIESEKPSRGTPKQSLADEQPPQETPLPDPTPEFSGFAGYPHWGLNE
jgi:hypothetical protein